MDIVGRFRIISSAKRVVVPDGVWSYVRTPPDLGRLCDLTTIKKSRFKVKRRVERQQPISKSVRLMGPLPQADFGKGRSLNLKKVPRHVTA